MFGSHRGPLGCPLDPSLQDSILISRLINPTDFKAIEVPNNKAYGDDGNFTIEYCVWPASVNRCCLNCKTSLQEVWSADGSTDIT